jgi:threonine dehydrogenase-like Zn-dependent dehydrogenase
MKAAVFDGINLKIEEMVIPTISDSQVLLKVMAVGVCGTDRAIINGDLPVSHLPLIPGHEIVGRVTKMGALVDRIWGEKRVTCEINSGVDYTCFFCQKEVFSQCVCRKAIGIDMDGGFAEYIAVESNLLHEIPASISSLDGTFIEPLAAAYQTFEMMPLGVDDQNIAIFGLGKLGLLIAQIAINLGRNVIVVDGSQIKLALAQSFGATHLINRHEIEEIPSMIKNLTEGIGADIIIDTTGNPKALTTIVNSCRTRGKIHMKSTHGLAVPLNITDLVVREITLYTSRCGPFQKAIAGLESGKIQVQEMISYEFSLENIKQALKSYNDCNTIKSVIKME